MAHPSERIHAVDATESTGFQPICATRERLESVGWRIDSALRNHENLIAAIAVAIVTLFASLIARRLPFDIDEYLVQTTALAGSPGAVWHILKTAPLSVDPPLFHFLTCYSIRFFGPSEFFTRLPSVLAYTVMTFVMYRFVRKYADIYTGLAVIALCLLCGAFPYAYDARPYSLWLAAGAMALLSWATIVEESPRRKPALIGLFLGIAIAVGSHWLGFLLLVPLTIGEGVRTWQKRRIDFAVWATVFAAAATALVYLPLLKAAAEYRALPWKDVALADISTSYHLVMEPCVTALTLLLVATALVRFFFRFPATDLSRQSIPTPVFICVVFFALAPFSTFLAGKLVSHAFQPRYALLCTIGLLPLMALAIRDVMGRSRLSMALAVLILSGCAFIVPYHTVRGLPKTGDSLASEDLSAFSAQPSLPIVTGGARLFLRMETRAPVSLRQRCIFPTSPDMIRLLHQNTNYLMNEGLRRWTKFPIVDLSSFLAGHPQFYMIQLSGSPSWLLERLREEHSDMSLQGTYDGNPVYLVSVRR